MSKSNYSKMFQCLRNGSFLVWWALWLPDILGFRFIVVLALNNAMFLLYLSDIKTTDFQAVLFQNIILDLPIGSLSSHVTLFLYAYFFHVAIKKFLIYTMKMPMGAYVVQFFNC